MKEKKQTKQFFERLMLFCLILFSGLFFYSLFKIVQWQMSVKENKDVQETIEKSIQMIQAQSGDEENAFLIDFESLKEMNSDIVGYLSIRNTDISYVVVKGRDNQYYLNHNFNKNYNIAGWIFADYKNRFDGQDKNIVIYGHNMKDKSMFGTLKNVLTKEWLENQDNQKIAFVTPKQTEYYQIFSCYEIEAEDYYIQTEFASDSEYEEFLKTISSRSIYDFQIVVNHQDSIITLSTCTDDGQKRIVVHAKKNIEEQTIQ